MPGDLVQGNEILIGVLEATVRDPSGRAPAPNYLAASGATCSSASAGVPSPIFTSARRRRQGALQLSCAGDFGRESRASQCLALFRHPNLNSLHNWRKFLRKAVASDRWPELNKSVGSRLKEEGKHLAKIHHDRFQVPRITRFDHPAQVAAQREYLLVQRLVSASNGYQLIADTLPPGQHRVPNATIAKPRYCEFASIPDTFMDFIVDEGKQFDAEIWPHALRELSDHHREIVIRDTCWSVAKQLPKKRQTFRALRSPQTNQSIDSSPRIATRLHQPTESVFDIISDR